MTADSECGPDNNEQNTNMNGTGEPLEILRAVHRSSCLKQFFGRNHLFNYVFTHNLGIRIKPNNFRLINIDMKEIPVESNCFITSCRTKQLRAVVIPVIRISKVHKKRSGRYTVELSPVSPGCAGGNVTVGEAFGYRSEKIQINPVALITDSFGADPYVLIIIIR